MIEKRCDDAIFYDAIRAVIAIFIIADALKYLKKTFSGAKNFTCT
jgi:hypothetical protein